MAFLLPYFQERDTLSSIPMEPPTSGAGDYSPATVATPSIASPPEDEVEEVEGCHQNPPPAKKKKKTDYQSPSAQLMRFVIDSHEKQQQQQQSRVEEMSNPPEKRHPIRNFLESIGDTIITFSKMEQHIAKDKIYNIISEMEFENIANATCSNRSSDGESSSLSRDPSL